MEFASGIYKLRIIIITIFLCIMSLFGWPLYVPLSTYLLMSKSSQTKISH